MSNYFNGKGTIGFTCDVCGRELNGCHVVNGMSFCEKCYQETFGKDNQQSEIQELKQQLATIQLENKTLKEFADKLDEEFGKNVEPTLSEKADNIIALYRTNKKYCEITYEKIKELKQQLEEKEKIIFYYENLIKKKPETAYEMCELLKPYEIKLRKYELKCKNIDEQMKAFEKRCQKYYNSDEYKKDFAIQKLENIKKLLLEESKRYPIVYDITDDLVGGAIDKDKTFEIIDNQIKKLKGE